LKALKNHSLWFSKVLKTSVISHLLKIKIKSFLDLFQCVLKTKMTPNNPLTNHVCFRQLEIRNKDGKSKPRAAKIRRNWGFFFLVLPFLVAMQVYLSLFFFTEPDRSLFYMAILPNLNQFNFPKAQTLMT